MTDTITFTREPQFIDPARWPDLTTVPTTTWRTGLARMIMRNAVKNLPMRVRVAGIGTWGAGSSADPMMVIVNPEAFFARLGSSGLIGFGESYMAGEWTTTNAETLTDVVAVLANNVANLVPASWQRLRSLAVRRSPVETRDWRQAAQQDIAAHYDLSNDMFAAFLDSTMTYSAALFDDENSAEWADLTPAQHAKIDRLLDETGVGEGTEVLEVGTGWGGLAIRAAQRGARVTTVTLSEQQAILARQRVEEAGLADRVDVRLQDYRDVTGTFDAIISVEMIEAIGYDQWPTYFAALERMLAPGGKIGLQVITMPDDRLEATRHTYTWIQKYIFPGGLLLSTEAIDRTIAAHTHLAVQGRLSFGRHYATTLRLWEERFDANWEHLRSLGLDETFRRMWRFYLCYARAGFAAGYLDVQQYVIEAR